MTGSSLDRLFLREFRSFRDHWIRWKHFQTRIYRASLRSASVLSLPIRYIFRTFWLTYSLRVILNFRQTTFWLTVFSLHPKDSIFININVFLLQAILKSLTLFKIYLHLYKTIYINYSMFYLSNLKQNISWSSQCQV